MDPDNPFSNDWNSLDLRPPLIEFFKSNETNVTYARQAVIMEHRANRIRHLLFVEMTLLSKLLETRRHKYRSDKGFKTIAKIEKTVNRIHQLDLKTVTKVLKANLSDGKFAPSKQVCQWLLIKLISYGLLLNRSIECCKYCISMLNHRLRTGHSWTELLVAMAMVSRIWSLSTNLVNKCCFSYRKLIKIQDDLPSNPKDTSWIFIDYQFPQNLEKWISQPHNIPSFSRKEEIISQPSQTKPFVSKSTKHHAKAEKKIRKIKSTKSLKNFILEERKLRRLKKYCVSKYLNDVQWEEVEKKLIGCYKMLSGSNDKVTLLKRIRKKVKKWLLNC